MTDFAATGHGLLDGPTLAVFLGIPHGTLRWWASEGLITRRGTGPNRVALYDVGEVGKLAAKRRRLTRAG